jgi:hypothetical protein
MELSTDERYKIIVEEHRFASNFRVKIVTGWCAIYAALALVFKWAQEGDAKPLSWIISLAALIVTILMWMADYRNARAIRSSHEVGAAIEKKLNIPEEERFFWSLKKGWFISHTVAIFIFALLMWCFLLWLTIRLFSLEGLLFGYC